MTCHEEYLKARDKGKTKVMTSQIFTWDEEKTSLCGKVLSVVPFEHGKFDTEVNMYRIDSDGIIYTTVLGSATDAQLKDIDPVGQNIYIEYQGKKQLDDGRQINLFHVEVY